MCNCIDVEMGSYGNQTEITIPKWITIKSCDGEVKSVLSIDSCMTAEIISLWYNEITTTGCCCGHNKQSAYIGVIDSDIPKMLEMGYTVQHNPCRPDDRDTFNSKTVQ